MKVNRIASYKKAIQCLNEGLQAFEQEQEQGEDKFYEITQVKRIISMLHGIGQKKATIK